MDPGITNKEMGTIWINPLGCERERSTSSWDFKAVPSLKEPEKAVLDLEVQA